MSEEHDAYSAEPEFTVKRRIPDRLRKYLLTMKNGKSYLPAAYRIAWFRDEMGDEWGIVTELIEGGHAVGFATVKATILRPDGSIAAQGHKTEAKDDFPAGWVEKAESGAVARALGFLGFGTQFLPELDELPRVVDSPQHPAGEAQKMPGRLPAGTRSINDAETPCPSCHAPAGKSHATSCKTIQGSLVHVPKLVDNVAAFRR